MQFKLDPLVSDIYIHSMNGKLENAIYTLKVQCILLMNLMFVRDKFNNQCICF